MMAKHGGPQAPYKRDGFGGVWAWAKGHFFRWVQAAKWSKRKLEHADTPADRSKWTHAHEEYVRKAKAGRKRRHNGKDGWPEHFVIEELFNNDNGLHNHLHVASANREGLLAVAKIAAERYGEVYVREFPPFDPVECVHAVCVSWHYRDGSNPFTPRCCSNMGDGCAFDLGAAARDEFGRELKSRYGANRCDF